MTFIKTLEIRWHETQPILSSDFQPYPPHQLKRILHQPAASSSSTCSTPGPPSSSGKEREREASSSGATTAGRSYRLATAGADNHVRLWLIHPNISDGSNPTSSSSAPSRLPPRAEFLATLKRHSAAVNVVRWSPREEVLASAGDDGVVLLWVPKITLGDASSSSSAVGSSSSAFPDSSKLEEGEKEAWKMRLLIRATTNEIYDLAWSPDGAHIIVGSTDNTARIYDATTGNCIKEIAEHSHFVQGVAWDPLNEYIATQSSDRSVHIHRIHQNKGELEFYPYSRSQKIDVHHSRTPSTTVNLTPSTHPHPESSSASSSKTRPTFLRHTSAAASETESSTAVSDSALDDSNHGLGPLTPNTSTPNTPSLTSASGSMKPPSRRSSFASSAGGAGSPPPPDFSSLRNTSASSTTGRSIGRSPSPLPAIRPATNPSPAARTLVTNNKLYGDESFTTYFRRLTFSPDGALLLTPAGQIDEQLLSFPPTHASAVDTDTSSASSSSNFPLQQKVRRAVEGSAKPTVYIYSRANLSNSPIAHLPGQKTASVAVKFSPVFYELRDVTSSTTGIGGSVVGGEPKTFVLDEKSGDERKIKLGLGATTNPSPSSPPPIAQPHPPPSPSTSISLTSPAPAHATPATAIAPSPSRSTKANPPASPAPPPAVFALPYRLYFAVATQDAVLLYDTQQTGPIAIFVGLHYAGFTDIAWSPDGQTLILSSIDGYCSVVVFDAHELGTLHTTQQHQKQLSYLASSLSHHPSSSFSSSSSVPPTASPSPSISHAKPAAVVVGSSSSSSSLGVTKGTSAGGGASSRPTSPARAPMQGVLTPAAAGPVGESAGGSGEKRAAQEEGGGSPRSSAAVAAAGGQAAGGGNDDGKKKKRRVELTHIGSFD